MVAHGLSVPQKVWGVSWQLVSANSNSISYDILIKKNTSVCIEEGDFRVTIGVLINERLVSEENVYEHLGYKKQCDTKHSEP